MSGAAAEASGSRAPPSCMYGTYTLCEHCALPVRLEYQYGPCLLGQWNDMSPSMHLRPTLMTGGVDSSKYGEMNPIS